MHTYPIVLGRLAEFTVLKNFKVYLMTQEVESGPKETQARVTSNIICALSD